MKKIGDLTTEQSDIKMLKEEKSWDDEIDFPEELHDEVFIKHIKGPLFFGTTSDFQMLSKQLPDTASTVIMRLDKMSYMDQSGLYTMEDIIIDLVKKGKHVLLVHIDEQPMYMLERIDIIPDLIPKNQIFDDFKDCLKWIKDNKTINTIENK